MKTGFNLIIFVFCCLMGNTLNCSAQNVALHKQYKLSALPNYPHSVPPFDRSSLTDGILI